MSEDEDGFWFWLWVFDGLPGFVLVLVVAVVAICALFSWRPL